MYSILVVGHGYVGSAVSSVFKADKITIIDPKFNNNKIKDFKDCSFDIIFVCVDTPKNEKFKTLDTVLSEINSIFTYKPIVCIKSTATPRFFLTAKAKYKKIKIVFYPEYLSHYNNIADFKNQNFIILGGEKKPCKIVERILISRLKNVHKAHITDIATAALVKYAENGFLSYKVTFFNEMYHIHKKLKIPSTYREFADLLVLDKRIGSSHTEVPGRDGKYGWGGHCYTKDNYEFLRFSKSPLLKFLIKINSQHRKYTK